VLVSANSIGCYLRDVGLRGKIYIKESDHVGRPISRCIISQISRTESEVTHLGVVVVAEVKGYFGVGAAAASRVDDRPGHVCASALPMSDRNAELATRTVCCGVSGGLNGDDDDNPYGYHD